MHLAVAMVVVIVVSSIAIPTANASMFDFDPLAFNPGITFNPCIDGSGSSNPLGDEDPAPPGKGDVLMQGMQARLRGGVTGGPLGAASFMLEASRRNARAARRLLSGGGDRFVRP